MKTKAFRVKVNGTSIPLMATRFSGKDSEVLEEEGWGNTYVIYTVMRPEVGSSTNSIVDVARWCDGYPLNEELIDFLSELESQEGWTLLEHDGEYEF